MNPHQLEASLLKDFHHLHELRRKYLVTHEQHIAFISNLRKAVQHKCPLNKVGNYLVSDYDLLDASFDELKLALMETLK